jgi:transcriptional regulator with XRE-family HTH domain
MILGMAADDIGTRIRKRRQELDLSQEQLAGRVGVHPSTIINWEKGKHPPKRRQGKLEAVLGISLSSDPPPLRRVVDAHTRSVLRAALPDDDDYRRVIGLMEGTLTWPAEQAPDAAGTQEGRSG